MSKVQFYIVAALLVLKIQKGQCNGSDLSKTTEILFNLTNYAIESRRIRSPCDNEVDHNNYFSCVQKLLTSPNNYGLVRPPHNYNYYQKPYPHPQIIKPENPHSVMEILFTIAHNDALRCVPRLLCEVTSDTISKNRQDFTLPTLPFNIDMKSIISLLSIIDLPGGSPVPFFAKAALLGYVSKGNSDSCLDAYPTCPRDPNKLIQYLNNYNGGFFRFFSGVNRPIRQNYGLINYPHYGHAQKRILNKHHDGFEGSNRLPKKLSFPKDDDSVYNEFTFKKPKELPFSINEYYSNELDLQRPLPNHKATPLIFPTRTGTGDLRLDSEELNENYEHQSQYYYQNNNFIRFNEGFHESPQGSLNHNKAVFTFPV